MSLVAECALALRVHDSFVVHDANLDRLTHTMKTAYEERIGSSIPVSDPAACPHHGSLQS